MTHPNTQPKTKRSTLQSESRMVSGTKRRRRRNNKVNPSGGYTIARELVPPSASGYVLGRPERRFKQVGRNSVVVCSSEIINGVNTNVAAVPSLSVQQALIPSSFPWLAGVAENFNKWRWNYLRLIYVPNCPTSTPGAVTFLLDYDHADAVPTTRIEASAGDYSISTPYWGGFNGATLLNKPHRAIVDGSVDLEFDVTRVGKPWYPYYSSVNFAAQTSVDRNIYSPGQVLAVSDGSGLAVAISAGTLYAQYEIELIEPYPSARNS